MTYIKSNNFIEKYINNFNNLSKLNDKNLNNLETLKPKKQIIHVFGNGGSASIASHFSLDLTMNTKLRAKNYNEASIITCLANDLGYQNFISKSLQLYA